MAFNPEIIVAGPAIIQYKGVTIYSEGDVSVSLDKELKDKRVSFAGTVAQKLLSQKATITFKPDRLYAVLFPYGNFNLGTKTFGNTDVPLIVWSVDGKKYTFQRVAITKMPSLNLGVSKDIIGDVEFTGIKSVLKNWEDDDAIFAVEDAAQPATPVNPASYRDGPFTVTYDGNVIDVTDDGVDVALNLTTKEVIVDREGQVDAFFSNLEITVNFTPVTWDEEEYLAAASSLGVARGALVSGKPLVIADPVGTIITLDSVVPGKSGLKFGAETFRQDAVEFKGVRAVVNGALGPWFTIGFTDAAETPAPAPPPE